MTNDVSRCEYYKKHSQNVAEKWICNPVGLDKLSENARNDLDRYFRRNPVPQTEEECQVCNYFLWIIQRKPKNLPYR